MARNRDSRSVLIQTMARLLREQGYTATGLAQLLAESGASNGSLYHHFPGGLEEVAEAGLDASRQVVSGALRDALETSPDTPAGIVRFLDIAQQPIGPDSCPGCPIAPTALESPVISPRLRAVAARAFDEWEDLIAERLRADGWPEDAVRQTASSALALVEGALLLARVSGEVSPLVNAQRAARVLLTGHVD